MPQCQIKYAGNTAPFNPETPESYIMFLPETHIHIVDENMIYQT